MSQVSPILQLEASQSIKHKYSVMIDTDIGDDIDDTFALALALHSPEIEKLHYQNTPQTCLLSKLSAIWQRHRPRWHPRLPFLHDPLAITAFCVPELFQFEVMTVRVLTSGALKGCILTRKLDGPLVFGATSIKHEHARRWIMQRPLSSAI